MKQFRMFADAIDVALAMFPPTPVQPSRWQGVDVSHRHEMQMHEVLFYSFKVPMRHCVLEDHARDIKPSLPWADNHFLERVCGAPINPGVEWENWPYSHSARQFLEEDGGMFNHNYMERYWPKYAGTCNFPTKIPQDFVHPELDQTIWELENLPPHIGIRGAWGDLGDVVETLAREPDTRQAFLPVWFPEDTNSENRGRKPCTLGYHFLIRNGKLHIVYYIRSCDYVRHFRDDIYLTVRLALWMIDQVSDRVGRLIATPGDFIMHISSLHMFRNDYIALKGS